MQKGITNGGTVAEIISDNEKNAINLLPLMATWIMNDRQPTQGQFIALLSKYPEHFGMSASPPLDDMVSIIRKYANDPFFGRSVKTVLSPKGREWIETFYILMKEARKSLDD